MLFNHIQSLKGHVPSDLSTHSFTCLKMVVMRLVWICLEMRGIWRWWRQSFERHDMLSSESCLFGFCSCCCCHSLTYLNNVISIEKYRYTSNILYICWNYSHNSSPLACVSICCTHWLYSVHNVMECQHGIDDSIRYLTKIACSFILKSGVKYLPTWPTTFGSRCLQKGVVSFAFTGWRHL